MWLLIPSNGLTLGEAELLAGEEGTPGAQPHDTFLPNLPTRMA